MQILHVTTSRYPDSSSIVWTQELIFYLAERQSEVNVMLPCSRTKVLRSKIFLNDVVLQDRSWPSQELHIQMKLCIVNVCLFLPSLRRKKIYSFLLIKLHFLQAAQYTSTWLAPLWYKTIERKEKVTVLETHEATPIIQDFFSSGVILQSYEFLCLGFLHEVIFAGSRRLKSSLSNFGHKFCHASAFGSFDSLLITKIII